MHVLWLGHPEPTTEAMMRIVLLVLSVLLVGCYPSTEPDPEAFGDRVRIPGTLDFGDGPRISMTSRDQSLSVSIGTYGPSCYRKGETEVEVDGLRAVVKPYNYAPRPGSGCTRDIRLFEHTATIRFGQSGTARVVVHGLSTVTDPYGESITVERTVTLP